MKQMRKIKLMDSRSLLTCAEVSENKINEDPLSVEAFQVRQLEGRIMEFKKILLRVYIVVLCTATNRKTHDK